MTDFSNKKIAILGLGIEGIGLCDFLQDKVSSISVIDQKSKEALLENSPLDLRSNVQDILDSPKIDFIQKDDILSELYGYDLVFRSPSVYFLDEALENAKKNGVQISSQIKLFFELCPCKIIGVTGTKGKGTTSSLIYEIIKTHFAKEAAGSRVYLAGNIGKAAITLVPILKAQDIVVLELSNFQLADLTQSPQIAVVTNLGVDHLDYHKSVDEYLEAKTSIVKFQSTDNLAVLNKYSSFSQEVQSKCLSEKKYFSPYDDHSDCVIRSRGEVSGVFLDPKERNLEVCSSDHIRLLGRHNLENIAAAALVADSLEIPIELIRDVVMNFEGLPYRLEFVTEVEGVKYINDSFATNPGPTIAAIKSFSEPKVLILGGSEKGADFSELALTISEAEIRGIVLIGQEANRIKEALSANRYHGQILEGAIDASQIVSQAKALAKKGDVVLFSPACASFDMFLNYKDRGEQFKKVVLALK
jgi:UDP-N-acetylmuramoylalanine--D-glutamate ligase